MVELGAKERWWWGVMAAALSSACNAAYSLDGYDDGRPAVPADAGVDGAARSSYAEVVLADHPDAYFRLGEREGSAAVSQAGTIAGVYRSVTLGVPGAIAGDPDSAARFESNGGAIVVGKDFDLVGGTEFSLEVWAKPTVIDATYRRLITKRVTNGASDDGWSLVHNSERHLTLETYVAGKWAGGLTDQSLPSGVYSHIVVTYDKATLRFYVDSALAKEFATDIRLSGNGADLVIGAISTANGNVWVGDLDEVALYHHALSADRVSAHYRAGRSY
jgi:hypothetical protein